MKRYILKWAAVILSALCLTVLLTVGVSAAERNIENDDALRVGYGNLVFKDTIYLRYAVSTETYSAEDMVLLVWTEPKASVDEYLYGTQSMTLSPTGTVGISGVTHAVFDYKGLTAKQMTDYIYARVCIPSEDATEAKYGAVVKYSVLQYSYSMLGKTGSNGTTNEKLIKLLNAMLNYGAAAQEYTEYKTDWLANDAFYEVKVAGGTLPDGTTTGLYKKDSKVMLTADAAADGCKFAGWQNSAGETVSTDEAYEITVGEKNEVYMAVYEEAVKYSEGLLFTSNGDGTCYVSGIGSCEDTDLVIPPTSPEGWKVTGVGDHAFIRCSGLTQITIPDSVVSIGIYAFEGCRSLTSITIPDGVTCMSTGVFSGCSSLTSISIPDNVTSIGRQAFSYCNSLTSISIPDDVTDMGYEAFSPCSSLTSVAFEDNSQLTSISQSAFKFCSALMSVDFGDNSQLMSICGYAFHGCSSLTSINIPAGVTRIDDCAFYGCSALADIYYPSTEAEWATITIASSGNTPLLTATIHYNYKTSSQGLVFTANGDGTCYVSGIGTCSDTDIIIPKVSPVGDIVTTIGYRAFFECTDVRSIEIPNGVKNICGDAFFGCWFLKISEIPDSVTNIGDRAFGQCYDLTDVYYTGTEEQWASTLIGSGNSRLTSATIHYNYTPDP